MYPLSGIVRQGKADAHADFGAHRNKIKKTGKGKPLAGFALRKVARNRATVLLLRIGVNTPI